MSDCVAVGFLAGWFASFAFFVFVLPYIDKRIDGRRKENGQ